MTCEALKPGGEIDSKYGRINPAIVQNQIVIGNIADHFCRLLA